MTLNIAYALSDLERQLHQLSNEVAALYDHHLPKIAGPVVAMNPQTTPSAQLERKPETVLERILDITTSVNKLGRAVLDMNTHLGSQFAEKDIGMRDGASDHTMRPSMATYNPR